jgi:hypothetical protein
VSDPEKQREITRLKLVFWELLARDYWKIRNFRTG